MRNSDIARIRDYDLKELPQHEITSTSFRSNLPSLSYHKSSKPIFQKCCLKFQVLKFRLL